MKWLTNIGDPKKPVYDPEELHEYLKGKVIGDPQATSTYTVDQLKALGMVGVYAPDPVTIVEAST